MGAVSGVPRGVPPGSAGVPPALAATKEEQGRAERARRPRSQEEGGHGNLTALISLGIPKLVRFHKIRPQQPDTVHMILLYPIRPPSARGLPERRVERADGALAPRQRDAFVAIEPGEPRADVRQDVVVKWDYAPSTVVPWGHGLGRARASARSIAQHKRSENEGGRRNPVKSGASVRSSRVGFASIAPFRARRDRGRLPPTTGPVCQGWAIPSRANNGHSVEAALVRPRVFWADQRKVFGHRMP